MDRVASDKETRELSDDFVSKILMFSTMIDQQLTLMICEQLTGKILHIADFIEYFDNVSFSRKIDLIKLILKHNYIQFYSDYQEPLKQIKQIKDIRDRIAHHGRSYEYDGQKIRHVLRPTIVRIDRDRNGRFIEKNVKKYTVNEMKGLMKMTENCYEKILELESKLRTAIYHQRINPKK